MTSSSTSKPPCGFCNGQPVGDAASWQDGKLRPPVACPRCGEVPANRATVLACGTRKWRDPHVALQALVREMRERGWEPPDVTVIHGDNGGIDPETRELVGADRIAAREAQRLGCEVVAFPADWDRYGKKAGPLRNLQMLDAGPDLVVAFGEGKGTNHTCREAEKRGIPVRRY